MKSWLPTLREASSAKLRLYCFHHAGGGPSVYREWSAQLRGDVEVVPVLLPGRGLRFDEQPYTRMAPLVEGVLAALRPTLDRPFAFFGHSMGALVAFEVTVAMEGSGGATPEHLFVSGRRSPDELHRGEPIHALPEDAFLTEMQRLYGGVPEAVRNEPELLALFLPALRADVEVFETYAPLTDRKVTCPLRVYGGTDDRRPKPETLPGWQRVAERPISVQTFPGDHFYLNTQSGPLLADLAAHWAALVV